MKSQSARPKDTRMYVYNMSIRFSCCLSVKQMTKNKQSKVSSGTVYKRRRETWPRVVCLLNRWQRTNSPRCLVVLSTKEDERLDHVTILETSLSRLFRWHWLLRMSWVISESELLQSSLIQPWHHRTHHFLDECESVIDTPNIPGRLSDSTPLMPM